MSLFSSGNAAKPGEGGKKNAAGRAIIVQFDGGSRGNPGPAGIGVTLTEHSGEVIYELGEFLGNCTNNVAEYTALVRGLAAAKALGVPHVTVRADSELVVRQINGVYKVKSPDLKPLYQQAIALMAEIPDVKVVHVYREGNTRADELANMAMDRAAVGGGRGLRIEPLGPLADAVAGFGTGAAPAKRAPKVPPRKETATPEMGAGGVIAGIGALREIAKLLREPDGDLSPKALDALLIIAESPGRTQVEISHEMKLSDALTYRVVAEELMLRHQFVLHGHASDEQEARGFFLTKKGRQFVERLAKASSLPRP